ncbi:hypothetical protein EI94DRAFT_1697341 [Lactarius quietus]|nr:hypothetical protein EI94DRAFT_1697341 [Lactarius quietus]
MAVGGTGRAHTMCTLLHVCRLNLCPSVTAMCMVGGWLQHHCGMSWLTAPVIVHHCHWYCRVCEAQVDWETTEGLGKLSSLWQDMFFGVLEGEEGRGSEEGRNEKFKEERLRKNNEVRFLLAASGTLSHATRLSLCKAN